MSKLIESFLKICRKIFLFLFSKPYYRKTNFEGQDASDIIKSSISSNKPFMLGRFGAVELISMVAYKNSNKKGFRKYFNYVTGQIGAYYLKDEIIASCNVNAGIFPPTKEVVSRFCQLMIEDANELDIIGKWLRNEDDFIDNDNIISIRLKDMEPYIHKKPWTIALKNKKVLVIHPFTESIKSQYARRNKIFKNQDVLPEFELITIKSIQSNAGNVKLPFSNWFEALDSMKQEINNIDFDIAIIGCGAYGFPLAAHVKRIGKQAIHLGGATQILFGIKGKRWDNIPFVAEHFNDYWVKPTENETPKEKDKVEDGCYW